LANEASLGDGKKEERQSKRNKNDRENDEI